MSCETPGCIVNLFLKFTNVKMEGQINNLIEIELKNNCVFTLFAMAESCLEPGTYLVSYHLFHRKLNFTY